MSRKPATPITRRSMLAGTAFGMYAAWTHQGTAQTDRNEVIRVGVAGVNGRGGNLAGQFDNISGVETVALCDVNQLTLQKRLQDLRNRTGRQLKQFADVRKMIDDENIDVIVVTTPPHWHALIACWAMQAKKDVYVEHPCSHNVTEGRRLVQAAAKYGCIFQHGTQFRSGTDVHTVIDFLRSGKLGKIQTAVVQLKGGWAINKFPLATPPQTLDWNLWLGPAPLRQYSQRYTPSHWRWYWDFGNGVVGDPGSHYLDLARWGLGKDTHPTKIHALGGRYGVDDDAETPNTFMYSYDYGDVSLRLEAGNQNKEVRNIWYGTEGYLVLDGKKWQAFLGPDAVPNRSRRRKSKTTGTLHIENFTTAVKSREAASLAAPIDQAHFSATLEHLGNIAYRTGRTLSFDPKTETFPGDEAANRYLSREYREPFVMPKEV